LTTKSNAPARIAVDHHLDPAMAGLDDHRDDRIRRAEPFKHIKPVHFRHHQIQHQRVDRSTGAIEAVERGTPVVKQFA
jgi:hypothetical protein